MSPRRSTASPCGARNRPSSVPGGVSPKRPISLPSWSTMLTRGPRLGMSRVDCGGGADLADVADRPVTVGHIHAARPVQVLPLGLEFAIAIEHLNTVVLAVDDIDPAVGIGADIVDNVELALAGAGLAPRH